MVDNNHYVSEEEYGEYNALVLDTILIYCGLCL